MFLTHKDDVGDHAKWKKAFPDMVRVIHDLEVTERQGTTACEVKLEGEGPWKLPDGGDDVELIFAPGHTEGCVCLLYRPAKALFSGDHLAATWRSPDQKLAIFQASELVLSSEAAGECGQVAAVRLPVPAARARPSGGLLRCRRPHSLHPGPAAARRICHSCHGLTYLEAS
eukprot:jgi/Botrbrau1/8011/Bobra.384_2s0033.1